MREFGVCLQCGHRKTETACRKSKAKADNVCGLTGEAIGQPEVKKICVNFRPS